MPLCDPVLMIEGMRCPADENRIFVKTSACDCEGEPREIQGCNEGESEKRMHGWEGQTFDVLISSLSVPDQVAIAKLGRGF